MLIKMNCANGGGGSNVVSGESDTITGASETITINTGLSEITRFFAYFYCDAWNPSYFEYIFYDKDHSTTKYIGAVNYGSSNFGQLSVDLGTYPHPSYCMKMDAPSDGTVTITTATTGTTAGSYAGVGKKIRWFAE